MVVVNVEETLGDHHARRIWSVHMIEAGVEGSGVEGSHDYNASEERRLLKDADSTGWPGVD